MKAEEVAAEERRARRADEEVVGVLRAEAAAADEADGRGRERVLPTELRLGVVRAGEREEARERVGGRVGDVRRGPANLLDAAAGDLDRLELTDARRGPHDLHPAAVEPGLD